MEKREFVGKTLDDALNEAAKSFGVERNSICHTVTQQGNTGFLAKFFARGVKIEAWVEDSDALHETARAAVREALGSHAGLGRSPKAAGVSKRANPKGAPAPRNSAVTLSTESGNSAQGISLVQRKFPEESEQGRASLEGRPSLTLDDPGVEPIFEEFRNRFFATFETPISDVSVARDEAGIVRVQVNDEFLEDILSKSDKLSNAFEHVLKRILQKKIGDVAGRVTLDARNAGNLRQEHLKEVAISIAEKVKKSGRSVTLSSKTSQERRVIHLALDGYPGVATKSVGSTDRRRLVIYATDVRVNTERRQRNPQQPALSGAGRTGSGRSKRSNRSRRPRNSGTVGGGTAPASEDSSNVES